jgi:hypothetical protein
MGLDPSDDCTFWFTGEYNTSTTWTTRWASFEFDQCGCLVEPSVPDLQATTDSYNEVDLTWDDSDLDTVTSYEVRRSRTAGGPYDTIAVIADTSPGVPGGPGYAYTDTDVSGGIPYYYVVVAGDGGACKSSLTNEVTVTPDGICTLRPLFDGIAGAGIDVSDTCGNVVNWGAATPECGSQVLFNLYRSTDPGFIPGPANRVASGITGTVAIDRAGLVAGTEYYYVARALDTSNLVEDLNEVKASVVVGGTGGQETLFFDDFEDAGTFGDWTVTTGPGFHRCGEWARSSIGDRRPTGGSGIFAMANSFDCDQLLPSTSASMDSPAIDLSSPSLSAVILDFDIYYNHFNGDDATVEVWDGSQWVVIWTDPDSDVNTKLSFDVSTWALGNSAFRVRFNYQNASASRWFSVDNVRVGVDLICSTAPAPSPVPDGFGGTTPLRGSRLSATGDSIELTWDAATCGPTVHNLLYGDLANVATHSLSGGECSIGNSGSFAWNGVPAGDLFFLLVGGDGAVTESSWGHATAGERNGLTASGTCGATDKNLAATCPD